MAKLPPTPVGMPPGHSFWNDWYEQLRRLVNSTIVNHNDLQNIQGGSASERYHLTSAQQSVVANLPTLDSGSFTPTLTNTTNVASSTANLCYYIRVGGYVYVFGSVAITPTSASTATTLTMSTPVSTTFADSLQGRGSAVRGSTAVANIPAPILSVASTSNVQISYLNDTDTTNRTWSFQYGFKIV